jgi:hypothetical protein
MESNPGFLAAFSLRRLFAPTQTKLTARIAGLAARVSEGGSEARPCPNCGFGRLFPIPEGRPKAGMWRCDRMGCGHLSEAFG